MAVEKKTSTTNGDGNYWTLGSVERIRVVAGKLHVCAEMDLWPDKATYEAATRHPLRRHRDVIVQLDNLDPSLSEICAAAEDLLMVEGTPEQLSRKEVTEQEFRAPTDATAKAPADPGQKAREYVSPLPFERAVEAGPLAGGVRV